MNTMKTLITRSMSYTMYVNRDKGCATGRIFDECRFAARLTACIVSFRDIETTILPTQGNIYFHRRLL